MTPLKELFMEGYRKIIAILGKSGTGKTVLQDMLESRYGIPRIVSHTTRPRRGDNDNSHVFLTEKEMSKLEGKIATTVFGGYKYAGVYPSGESGVHSYVIDKDGYRELNSTDNLLVIPVVISMNEKKRKKRISKERFERDKEVDFGISWGIHIVNDGSMLDLQDRADAIYEHIKEKGWV